MKTFTVYSSLPVASPRLACVFYALAAEGVAIQVRPLSELPTAPLGVARAQLTTLTVRLAEIGDRLTQADYGLVRLAVGEAQGLRAEADDLRARQRGLVATIAALKGGVSNG